MNLLPVPTQASAGLRSGVAHHDTVCVPHTIFSVYNSHVLLFFINTPACSIQTQQQKMDLDKAMTG